MTDNLSMTTAKMLRGLFHKHGMNTEVEELDKAIKAEEPKHKEPKAKQIAAQGDIGQSGSAAAASDDSGFGRTAETHRD